MRLWEGRVPITAFISLAMGVVLSLPLLLSNHTDGSYTCRGGALADFIHPEPELGADFRRNVAFDSGYACNNSARIQVIIAVVLVLSALGVALWQVRQAARR